MTKYSVALTYGALSTIVVFLLMFVVIAQGKHPYTGPVVFLLWIAWYASLFLFRCPHCRRSVFATIGPIPTGALPSRKCTKCGMSLTAKV